jgi:hypothetical protein
MKKIMTILAGSVVLIALAMTSCSESTTGEEAAAITLYISGGPTSRAAYPDIPGNGAFHNSIKYQIYFETGKPATHGKTPTAEKTGPGPHTVRVTPGAYRLFIVAILEDGVTYAEMDDSDSGVKYMDVDTRTTTTIPVSMHAKFPVFWDASDFPAITRYMYTFFNDGVPPIRMAVELSADNWAGILKAIGLGGIQQHELVDLDLSYCTTPNHVFDPAPGNNELAAGKAKISKITLPLDAGSIASYTSADYDSTFYGFSNLIEVDAPSVNTIGARAFKDCNALTTVSFPNVTTIADTAFAYCLSLKTVYLPNINIISQFAFVECRLETVDFCEATIIGNNAFQNCGALVTVNLQKAADIGDYAFYGCVSIETALLPKATNIGDYAFSGTKFASVNFPNATSIGSQAFEYCLKLASVSFTNATSIGVDAFDGCAALETVELPKATSIGYAAFINCTSLETVTLPEATSIGNYAFYGCIELGTLRIPKVVTIGNNAFTSTGDAALSLYLGSTPPNLGIELFNSVTGSKTVNVYVPGNTAASGTDYGPLSSIPRSLGSDNSGWLYGLVGSGWSSTDGNGSGTMTNPYIDAYISFAP